MARIVPGEGTARGLAGALRAVVAAGLALLGSSQALAIEAFDGRIQAHGFAEVQVRGLSRSFQEELDLAQWYNVLNVELEFDIAPDGIGPFDLISAFVRGEVRYDCVYEDGCGLFESVNTYGDGSSRVPERFRDAVDPDWTGVIRPLPGDRFRASGFGSNETGVWQRASDLGVAVDRVQKFPTRQLYNQQPGQSQGRVPLTVPGSTDLVQVSAFDGKRTTGVRPPGERTGFPGFDTLFRQSGADNIPNTDDDPGNYVMESVLGYQFGFADFRGPPSNNAQTQIIGPWLPKNKIKANAQLADRANPFRGRFTQSGGTRFYENDPALPADYNGPLDPLDPRIAPYLINVSPETALNRTNRAKNGFPAGSTNPANTRLFQFLPPTFGGDFSGIVPCQDHTTRSTGNLALRQIFGLDENAGCTPGSGFDPGPDGIWGIDPGPDGLFGTPDDNFDDEDVVTLSANIRLTGGTGELPFRPAPDVSALDTSANPDLLLAQGLYIPSRGLQGELRGDDLDSLEFNFREAERKWNRGSSQQDQKELKEAYVDIEMLDSRLWLRLGLQNIVWGKTELFRTTDQFNPQDLALASLPSLEESRIALWSGRLVYSLYNVGPLEDVRVELAANFDQFEPADLGACGEPYTIDVVCTLTTGIWAHSILGVGVAGIDRPDNPWDSAKGIEIGGRIEWRWDRFSFALTDFYGYNDFPYPDAIFFYDRNVDLATGRPLPGAVLGEARYSSGVCVRGGEQNPLLGNTAFANNPLSVTAEQDIQLRLANGTPFGDPIEDIVGGIGTDAGCLKPGGGTEGVNVYANNKSAQNNALQNHYANQQVFAWVCGTTVGIAAALDPGACAFTVFGSPRPLVDPGAIQGADFSLVEGLAYHFAGEADARLYGPFYAPIINTQKGALAGPSPVVPVKGLSSLQVGGGVDVTTRPGVTVLAQRAECPPGSPDPNSCAGWDGLERTFIAQQNPELDFVSLDESLTNEQRALIGCGPFFGTRCDSSRNDVLIYEGGMAGFFRVTDTYAEGGGVDFLNMEASPLVQSWPGVDGSGFRGERWNTTSNDAQPGTVDFVGGDRCTRFVQSRGLFKLPGCRGLRSFRIDRSGTPVADFEAGYLPSVDGCIIGSLIAGESVVATVDGQPLGAQLSRELDNCNTALVRRPVTADRPECEGTPRGPLPGGNPITGENFSAGERICNAVDTTLEELPLVHPLASCFADPNFVNPQFQRFAPDETRCNWQGRFQIDPATGNVIITEQLLNPLRDGDGNVEQVLAQLFQNELAAFSWNFLQFLVIASCDIAQRDVDGRDHAGDPETGEDAPDGQLSIWTIEGDPSCYFPQTPYAVDRCSLAAPQFCRNVQGFLAATGNENKSIKAGGNGRYGRRTFIWHSGGEAVLRYEKRNVLGFSTDFAEDVTKTNWGMEFTWVEGVPFQNVESLTGVTRSDSVNLTISIDRPTFINFLNPNRTFFFNTQWFFSYLTDYDDGFTTNGPVNVLFTFAMITGYYQDRLLPQFVTVYDFKSRSGGLLPSMSYRFTEAFSVTIGMLYFFGRTELVDTPIRGLAPAANQAGPNAYHQGQDNVLSLIRKRDEVFLRLRWTF